MPFKQKKNKRATVLILKDRMKNLSITYKNLADIIYLDKSLMDVLMKYFYFTGEYEGDNFIYGHFHTGFIERINGVIVANAGSVSLPKNDTPRSYIILEGKKIILKTLDGNIIKEETI